MLQNLNLFLHQVMINEVNKRGTATAWLYFVSCLFSPRSFVLPCVSLCVTPRLKLGVRQVLQRLLDNKVFIKAEKCEFNVAFLGYIFEIGQVTTDLVKIEAVLRLC